MVVRTQLSDIDEMCLENVANLCLNEFECDLEEYDALVTSLEEQRDIHQERVNALNDLLYKLRGHEDHLKKDPAQVEKLLQSLRGSLRM